MAVLYQAPGGLPQWGVPAIRREIPQGNNIGNAKLVSPLSREDRLFNAGKSLGKSVGRASTSGVAAGLLGPAVIASLADDWAQYKGAQMDADPIIQNQLSKLNALNKAGIIYDDEGNALDSKTMQPVSDELVENIADKALLPSELGRGTWEDKANPAFEMTPEEKLSRVGLEDFNFKARPSTKVENKDRGNTVIREEAKGNSLSGLQSLLALLALGAGGYYLGKKL